MLGPVDHLAHAVQAHGVERVIIALPATEHRSIAEIIEQCKQQRVGFYVVPDLFEIQLNTVDLDSIGGIPIIGLKDGGIVGWNFILKRLLDSWRLRSRTSLGKPGLLFDCARHQTRVVRAGILCGRTRWPGR